MSGAVVSEAIFYLRKYDRQTYWLCCDWWFVGEVVYGMEEVP